MSEYQYFEWQAIDRRLSDEERRAVSGLSSHIDVTATRAWVEYHWSGFKHEPIDVLAHYFDAFLYYAEWGMQRLAFRFPKDLLDERVLQPYLWEYCSELEPRGEHMILNISNPEEECSDPYEGEADLSTLAKLREDLIAGDYRLLYLTWLLAASANGIDEELEPLVPPGLKKLTPPLKEFMRFFNIDPFVVKAAAEASMPIPKAPAVDVNAAIAGLPREECDAFLRRLADDEPLLSVKLHRRLTELAAPLPNQQETRRRRTWSELWASAERLREDDEKRQQAEAEARHIQDLEQFAVREEQTWRDVDALIQRKQAPYYDQATALLVKLRDLAVHHDMMPQFRSRMKKLSSQYAGRPALLTKLYNAGLILSRSEIIGRPEDERLESDDARSLFAAQQDE